METNEPTHSTQYSATNPAFVPLSIAALRLGVHKAWLRREVDAKRIPHLAISNRILMNVEDVSYALRGRAAREVQ